jgi:23S rRNA (uracil1939-C5)-methyltransferase
MLAPGQIIVLAIDKPAAGGRMIGRVDGQVVLVGGAIPGEHVRARVERMSKGVAFAETLSVESASPDRRDPPGDPSADPLCGGCLFNYIAYPRQLEIKSQVIADAFARVAHLALPGPVTVAASREDGYRMRARLHVRGGKVGFFREGTHDLCSVRQTRQLLPETCDTLEWMEAVLRVAGTDALQAIELSENTDGSQRVVHLDAVRPLDSALSDRLHAVEGLTPGPYVTDTLSFDATEVTLRRHVLAFFQGNRYLLRDLVAHVVALVPAESTVADLYAGAGLFAIAAAVVRHAKVTAVEGDRVAADDLFVNATAAGGLVNTRHEAVEHVSASLRARVVIVDPPRTGVSKEALGVTLQLKAERIVYVSCDVATLARDARRIADAGYAITRADAFDLFPNTPHVETVVVFDRA